VLHDLKYPPRKGAAAGPLNCRVKACGNQSNLKYNRFFQYFLWVWTTFLPSKISSSSVCQKEPVLALFYSIPFLTFDGEDPPELCIIPLSS